MLPPRSTPGTPWQKTQLLTYSTGARLHVGRVVLHARDQRAQLYCTNSGSGALPPSANV